MALVNIGGRIYLPQWFSRTAALLGFGAAHLIAAAGEKHGVVFAVPKTGNISHLLFRVGVVTTSTTLRGGLQTVDAATGFPTGTAYGGMVAGTQAAPAANTLYEMALGTVAAAIVGNRVAMVIEFNAAVGNLNLSLAGGIRDMNQGLPYALRFGTAWLKQADLNATPIIGVKYDDGTYEFVGGIIGATATTATFNSGSTPDEQGNKITLDAPIRVVGLWCINNPAGDFDLVLYNSASTAIATSGNDKDILAGTGGRIITAPVDPVSLAIGTYRVAFKPTSVTNIECSYYSVNSNAQFGCNSSGAKMSRTHRTDAGAWTDVDTQQFQNIGLIVDQIDNGVRAPRLRRIA